VLFSSSNIVQTKTPNGSLGPASPLEVGMRFVAYYAKEEDAEALRSRFQRKLSTSIPDGSHFILEHARSASSVLYLSIIKKPPNVNIENILNQLYGVSNWVPVCTLDPRQANCPDIFELRKEGTFQKAHLRVRTLFCILLFRTSRSLKG
jgi:hypothetical protein